ncbi:MAG: helix-turn-helix domain-containing protein [Verrucomicrobia bacterium]|nr:helix-turn-helix domain-containing protein [Verrucomicrobiota bacterium]
MNTPTTHPTPRPDPEPWIDTTAACRHLSISAPTIRRWIKAGRLTPKRTPTGELRFRRSELDTLLD